MCIIIILIDVNTNCNIEQLLEEKLEWACVRNCSVQLH